MASTAMTGPGVRPLTSDPPNAVGLTFGVCPLLLGLDDLLAAVIARRRDVVAQVRLSRRGLGRHRRRREEIVRPVHAALRRALLVLLNGHSLLLSELLQARELRKGRFAPFRRLLPLRLHALESGFS